MFHKAMDMAKPGDVIMIDAGGSRARAIFGEIMAGYCRLRGIGGIVVDGSIRDSDTISEMKGFPVYAKGVTPNGPYKNGPGEIGGTISVGGVIVRPGDIVLGDPDGVIVIKPDEAEELLIKARAVMQRESAIIETMRVDGSYPRPWVEEKLQEINCEVL